MTNLMLRIPARQFTVSRYIWLAIIAGFFLDALWMWHESMSIDTSAMPGITLIFASITGFCSLFSALNYYVKRHDTFFFLGTIFNQFVCQSCVCGFLAYLAARLNFPVHDDALVAFGRFFGFEWLAYMHWLNSLPRGLLGILTFAYKTMIVQCWLIIFLLCLGNHSAHAQRYIIACLIAESLCITLASLYPTLGAYIYYNIDRDTFFAVQPSAARVHEAVLVALRDHSMLVIPMPLKGLISFPSFHTAAAVILMYASLPLARLRILLVPLNILMLFSTISEGGHWLGDVIGGIVIALLGIMAARRILPPQAA